MARQLAASATETQQDKLSPSPRDSSAKRIRLGVPHWYTPDRLTAGACHSFDEQYSMNHCWPKVVPGSGTHSVESRLSSVLRRSARMIRRVSKIAIYCLPYLVLVF